MAPPMMHMLRSYMGQPHVLPPRTWAFRGPGMHGFGMGGPRWGGPRWGGMRGGPRGMPGWRFRMHGMPGWGMHGHHGHQGNPGFGPQGPGMGPWMHGGPRTHTQHRAFMLWNDGTGWHRRPLATHGIDGAGIIGVALPEPGAWDVEPGPSSRHRRRCPRQTTPRP